MLDLFSYLSLRYRRSTHLPSRPLSHHGKTECTIEDRQPNDEEKQSCYSQLGLEPKFFYRTLKSQSIQETPSSHTYTPNPEKIKTKKGSIPPSPPHSSPSSPSPSSSSSSSPPPSHPPPHHPPAQPSPPSPHPPSNSPSQPSLSSPLSH